MKYKIIIHGLSKVQAQYIKEGNVTKYKTDIEVDD